MLVHHDRSQDETALVLVTPCKHVPLSSISQFLAYVFAEDESDDFGPFSFLENTTTKSIYPKDVTHVVPRSSYKIEHASSPNDNDSDENDVQVLIVLEESYYTQLKSEKGMNRPMNLMIIKVTMNHRLNEMKPVWMI